MLIVGLGATTPIGRSAWASGAAVRAGVAGFVQHPFMVDSEGTPMRVAAFPWMDASAPFADRVLEPLVASVAEALLPLSPVQERRCVHLVVNLPSARPGLSDDLAPWLRARIEDQWPRTFASVNVASLGHAGGLAALQGALQAMTADPEQAFVVAGADSYLDPDMLEWLEETDQLHSAGERNNAWGFIPGEGAGALALVTPGIARRHSLAPLGRVRSVGVGQEANLIRTDTVCLGLGLTDAVRGAFVALAQEERVTDVYCDMNGEPYRADEFAFLVTRTRERFVAASDFVAPADCWGDVGAATGPLLVALACIAGSKHYANGSSAVVWASSVCGARAAAVIDAAPVPQALDGHR